jgi:hypothetical protein
MHMGDGDPSMIPSIRVAGRPAANCVLTSVRHAERGVRWSIAVAVAHTPDRNRIIHGTAWALGRACTLLSGGSDTDANTEGF